MDKKSNANFPTWRSILSTICLVAFIPGTEASGQERALYEDYDTQMKGSDHIGPLGPSVFGDRTDFNSGATTFFVTDVSLPGNSGLAVALQRSLQAYDDGIEPPQTTFFPTWSNFEVPYLSGVFKSVPTQDGDTGWRSAHLNGSSLDRCSKTTGAPTVKQSSGKEEDWEKHEYSYGNHLYLPGGEQHPLRIVNSADPSHPTDGNTYRWATNSHWHFSCLTTTANAAGGEGFLGIAPDGTKYWFDWLVLWRGAPDLWKESFSGGPTVLQRAEYRLLVTRIEDRHGNWVNYAYSGKKLVEISANDGRSLTLTYETASPQRLTSVSDGTRTWTYSYTNGAQVTFPDSTVWRSSTSGPGIGRNVLQDCASDTMRFTGDFTLQVEQRTGATATFTFEPLRRGRSFTSWLSGHSCPSSLKHIDNIALYTKVVSGPDLVSKTWNISYGPPNGCYTAHAPTCSGASPTTRYVDVQGPESTFVRYTFGNKVNDTEGALLRVQTGTAASNILRDEELTWESVSGPGYASGGGYLASIIRLEKTRVISQGGVTYSTTQSGWDEYQNPGTIVESGPNGGSRTTQYTYYNNKTKWVVGEIATSTAPGISLTKTFNSNADVASVTKDGITTSYTYHADGNVATVTYPRSLVHSFSNYKLGIARAESQPEGISLSREVNDHGYLTSATDGEGRTTTYTYDVMGRVSAVDHPRGNDTTIAHTPLSTTVTRGALVETTTFDGLRRPVRVVRGGIVVDYEYDGYGRRTFQSNPGDTAGTQYEYDALGRTTKITNADGTFRSLQYPGSTVVEQDERGVGTTYTYRAYGDPERKVLMGITAPDPALNVSITRAPNDLVSGVAQGGFTRTFEYDSHNFLESETHPEIGAITYGRDAAGNMTSKTIGSAQTLFAYDGQNRQTGVTYPDATPSVTKSYTKTGKLSSVGSAVVARDLDYDGNDNLIYESLAIDGQVLEAIYTYTGNDDLATITYPVSGAVVSFAPDALGRATEVSGYITDVTYWPSNLPREVTYANGLVTEYDQNARLWPSTFQIRRGTSYYLDSDYDYDGAGNLTAIDDAVNPDMDRGLGYDAVNRLTSASGPWGTGTITYDGAGNIVSQTLGAFSLSYSYDAQNRLASVTGSQPAAYSYDLRGNVSVSAGRSFAYDAAPNLVCANCGGPNEVSYVYDGLNQRVKVTKSTTSTYEFHSVNGKLLTSYTPSQSNKVVEYIYLGDKRIAQRIVDGTAATTITPVETSLVADHNGSVTLAVDIGGSSPGGSVAFARQGTLLGTDFVASGQAAIEVGLPGGPHTITADYSGDESHSGNSLQYGIQVLDVKPPSITVPSGSTTGNYTISWGAATAAVSSYELYEATNSNFSGQTLVHSGTGTSKALTGRSNGNYYYRVRGCNAGTCSGYRTGANAVAVTLPPGIPPSISVPSGSTTGNYTISWGASSGTVTAYKLYEATSSNFSGQTLVYNGAGTSKALSGRGNGTYYYRVRACNGSACSGYRTGSNALSVTLPPGTPASISVPSSSSTGNYTISWGTASGTLTAYKLYEATNSSFSGQVQVYSGTAKTKALSGRSNGTYYYRVRACNGSSCSGYRTGGNATTVALVPAPPSGITGPIQSTTGNYSINWNSSAGATRYELWEANYGGSFSKVYDGPNTIKSFNSKPAGEYDYKAKACNSAGCSAFSSVTSCLVCNPECN